MRHDGDCGSLCGGMGSWVELAGEEVQMTKKAPVNCLNNHSKTKNKGGIHFLAKNYLSETFYVYV